MNEVQDFYGRSESREIVSSFDEGQGFLEEAAFI